MKLLSIAKVAKLLSVTPQTLRNWDKSNALKPVLIKNNGYRYYNAVDIEELIHKNDKKITIGYCRVSSKKQEDDLQRQVENVKMFMMAKGYQFKIIEDIGSGINYHKNGLNELINAVIAKKVERVVVLYKDRLLRFGFELLENIFKNYNCVIEVIDNTEKTEEQELVEDLIQIVTVFSCKLQGKRSKKTKELLHQLKND
jgi:predicted site-specific integrase-resolvase